MYAKDFEYSPTVVGIKFELFFLLLERKQSCDNEDEKGNKFMFPRPYKHKLCCLRPELIEGFVA